MEMKLYEEVAVGTTNVAEEDLVPKGVVEVLDAIPENPVSEFVFENASKDSKWTSVGYTTAGFIAGAALSVGIYYGVKGVKILIDKSRRNRALKKLRKEGVDEIIEANFSKDSDKKDE